MKSIEMNYCDKTNCLKKRKRFNWGEGDQEGNRNTITLERKHSLKVAFTNGEGALSGV